MYMMKTILNYFSRRKLKDKFERIDLNTKTCNLRLRLNAETKGCIDGLILDDKIDFFITNKKFNENPMQYIKNRVIFYMVFRP